MNTQTPSIKVFRSFALGMLAGASLVAGGLFIAHQSHGDTTRSMLVQSLKAQVQVPSKVLATREAEVVSATAQAMPAEVELPRALVIGHRLKFTAQKDPMARPGAGDLSGTAPVSWV